MIPVVIDSSDDDHGGGVAWIYDGDEIHITSQEGYHWELDVDSRQESGRYDPDTDQVLFYDHARKDLSYLHQEIADSLRAHRDDLLSSGVDWTDFGSSAIAGQGWEGSEPFFRLAADAENRANGGWPYDYNWLTSWLYLPKTDEVLMSPEEHQGHAEVIEEYEDNTGQEVNLNQPYEVGVLLRHDDGATNVIYPEYSDWDRWQRERIPFSEEHVLQKVKQKAEEHGWPIAGVLRGDDYKGDGEDVGTIQPIAKPVRVPDIIKFVSLPDRFLVGENTHHVYLLEAEYGMNEFPHDTGAIGRAGLQGDTILGIGFDYGTASAQQFAIQQLGQWAEKQGYKMATGLLQPIPGLQNY